ncbi:pYEATS domain-containing protein [uncultured Tateyamaria sp.]|uniref:pYEATS domain-containing protein n=1 Tax=Tateyamaria sp. 1078 TaxID=3417464 RepID=UPI002611B63F|nr:pYEATS domain-containing protein [uncultured Tateyamaria sp.]
MALRLKNSLIKDRAGRTKYKVLRAGGKRHFHVGVWLDADNPRELEAIAGVKYRLHHTFANAERQSRNRGNDFSITFWTWGAFEIRARALYADGTEADITPYTLQFSDDDFADLIDVSRDANEAG